jgi:hypothetical protein
MKSADVWLMLPLSLSDQVLKPVTLKAASCMVCNCRKQIVDCQKDPTCKAALACLENCAPNDQVWAYVGIFSRHAFRLIFSVHICGRSFASLFPSPLHDRLDLRMGCVCIDPQHVSVVLFSEHHF